LTLPVVEPKFNPAIVIQEPVTWLVGLNEVIVWPIELTGNAAKTRSAKKASGGRERMSKPPTFGGLAQRDAI
jgi:hypothetical protein